MGDTSKDGTEQHWMDAKRERTKYRRKLRRTATDAWSEAHRLIDEGREPEAAATLRNAADSIQEAYEERYVDTDT